MGNPVIIILQDQSLHALQQVIDEVDLRVGQSKAPNVDLGGSRAGLSGPLGPFLSGRGRASSPRPMALRSAHPCPRWGVGPSLLSEGARSPMVGTAFLLQRKLRKQNVHMFFLVRVWLTIRRKKKANLTDNYFIILLRNFYGKYIHDTRLFITKEWVNICL